MKTILKITHLPSILRFKRGLTNNIIIRPTTTPEAMVIIKFPHNGILSKDNTKLIKKFKLLSIYDPIFLMTNLAVLNE